MIVLLFCLRTFKRTYLRTYLLSFISVISSNFTALLSTNKCPTFVYTFISMAVSLFIFIHVYGHSCTCVPVEYKLPHPSHLVRRFNAVKKSSPHHPLNRLLSPSLSFIPPCSIPPFYPHFNSFSLLHHISLPHSSPSSPPPSPFLFLETPFYFFLASPTSPIDSSMWKDVKPYNSKMQIDAVHPFKDFSVITGREEGLERIWLTQSEVIL